MERKIYKDLLAWKTKKDRKPLILQGARQVGKTYIVNLFASKEYANYVYCNFEYDKKIKSLFSSDLIPSRIIADLAHYKQKEIILGHTLIIFDEIQACPEALTSLKYFCEYANEYHIIAMGSLLGLAVNRDTFSFPVGKVEFMNLYPLDFEEFLMATNNQYLIDEINKCYETNTPISEAFHMNALLLYKTYLFVGGMPSVVNEYIQSKNYELVKIKQIEILYSYFNDMSKYNKATEIPKTKMIYENISTQLAKENKKFKYSLVKPSARASEFENAIEWICLAGIANRLYRLEQIMLPLNSYKSLQDFKFYMNDVGLCCANENILVDDIIYDNENINYFKGGLVENYVNNQLIVNKLSCYYWNSTNQAEIDFITRIGKDIIPIEVKSSDNVRSKSLSVYVNKYKPTYSIKVSTKNFGFENNIKSVPLYAVFCIK